MAMSANKPRVPICLLGMKHHSKSEPMASRPNFKPVYSPDQQVLPSIKSLPRSMSLNNKHNNTLYESVDVVLTSSLPKEHERLVQSRHNSRMISRSRSVKPNSEIFDGVKRRQEQSRSSVIEIDKRRKQLLASILGSNADLKITRDPDYTKKTTVTPFEVIKQTLTLDKENDNNKDLKLQDLS